MFKENLNLIQENRIKMKLSVEKSEKVLNEFTNLNLFSVNFGFF